MLITTKFDNTCVACQEIAWAGEKVHFNPEGGKGQKIRHQACGPFARTEVTPVPIVETKNCRRCKTDKPLAEFSRHSRSSDGKQPYCKPCNREANKEYAKKRVESKTVTVVEPAPVEQKETNKVSLTQYASTLLELPTETIRDMKFGEVADLINTMHRLERLRRDNELTNV